MFREKLAGLATSVATGVGHFCHGVSIGAFVALTEGHALRTVLSSGPSLFCSCCGERWHVLTSAFCPNGCPWVYATFRGPSWSAKRDILTLVRKQHQESNAEAAAGHVRGWSEFARRETPEA